MAALRRRRSAAAAAHHQDPCACASTGPTAARSPCVCERLELAGLTDPFDLEVHLGDRVAVLGPNGTGKSHLLRLLGGDETVEHEGTFRLGARVHGRAVPPDRRAPRVRRPTPIQIMATHDLNEQAALSALGRYAIAECGPRPYETMSGGQRARLQVLNLELLGVNLLLLDEPTDNLDLQSAEALEAALAEFTGTVLAVTHDRWFLRGFDRYLILDADCSVAEALDRETALRGHHRRRELQLQPRQARAPELRSRGSLGPGGRSRRG